MPHKHKSLSPTPVTLDPVTLRDALADPFRREAVVAELVAILYGEDGLAAIAACGWLAVSRSHQAILPLVETVLWSEAEAPIERRLRLAAVEALRHLAPGDEMVVSTFLAASRDPDTVLAAEATRALGDCRAHAARAMRALTPCLEHRDQRVRRAARASLSRLRAA